MQLGLRTTTIVSAWGSEKMLIKTYLKITKNYIMVIFVSGQTNTRTQVFFHMESNLPAPKRKYHYIHLIKEEEKILFPRTRGLNTPLPFKHVCNNIKFSWEKRETQDIRDKIQLSKISPQERAWRGWEITLSNESAFNTASYFPNGKTTWLFPLQTPNPTTCIFSIVHRKAVPIDLIFRGHSESFLLGQT